MLETDTGRGIAPYDIVILGSGIAGLLLAEVLSARHRVVVVEQAKTLPVHKYWLTDEPSARCNPRLAAAIDSHYSAMEFRGYDGSCYTARGDYVLWDSPRLVTGLHDTATAHGARFLFDHRFLTLRYEADRIVVTVNDKELSARLVVDCMGYGSPIIYARDVVRIHGYYALYGATFDLEEPFVPVGLDNLMLSSEPAYLEAFPTSEGRVHTTIIVPTRVRRPSVGLAPDLKILTQRSRYARHLRSPGRSPRFLGGIVPVGSLRVRALDRLYFFGEAGQANPAASATALTRMLYTYHDVATALAEAVDRDRLSGPDLRRVTPRPMSTLNRRIQLSLFDRILQYNSDDFAAVIHELQRLDDTTFVNELMFATLHPGLGDATALVGRLVALRCFKLLKAVIAAALPL